MYAQKEHVKINNRRVPRNVGIFGQKTVIMLKID